MPAIAPTIVAHDDGYDHCGQRLPPARCARHRCMRASRSWPKSSVPNGCCHDGPSRRAAKSISLIGTLQSERPQQNRGNDGEQDHNAHNRQAMAAETSPCLEAWRETPLPTALGRSEASAVGDAGVEPAIQDIGDKVEKDDEAGEHEGHGHDDGRVIGEDRADEQRADARVCERSAR